MKKYSILFSLFFVAIVFVSFGVFLMFPFDSSNALAQRSAGSLIKVEGNSAVYYLGGDSKRYVFPNEKTYKTWYNDFSDVATISKEEMASYEIGGNITYKPGVRLVKIETDPKVYAVSGYGISGYANLHWIISEELASQLYGENWNSFVDDVSDVFFSNYSRGYDIDDFQDYYRENVAEQAYSPFTISKSYRTEDTSCEINEDCKSLGECDYGCWSTNYTPPNYAQNTACPAVTGPEKCVCVEKKCARE